MQTWKSGHAVHPSSLLKNAHRPIFHAHRCCKITLLLSQTNLQDNFDTTNLLFFRANDPSQASFNHPLTGTCIWFLHGRCLNIWILTPSLCRCDGKSWKWWSLANPFTWASNIWRGMKEASNSKHFIFRNLLILYLELKWPFVWFGLALYIYVICIIRMIVYVFKSHPAGMDEYSSKPRNQWETSTSPGHRRASNLLATNQDSVHPWFLGGRRNLSSWPVWCKGPDSYQES